MLAVYLSASGLSTSLADPAGTSPLLEAVKWVESTALGTVASSMAVIAIGFLGLMMLRGRLPLRRGGTVLLGCFVLFGASAIASGIMNSVGDASHQGGGVSAAVDPPEPLPDALRSVSNTQSGYDPYAGASVPTR